MSIQSRLRLSARSAGWHSQHGVAHISLRLFAGERDSRASPACCRPRSMSVGSQNCCGPSVCCSWEAKDVEGGACCWGTTWCCCRALAPVTAAVLDTCSTAHRDAQHSMGCCSPEAQHCGWRTARRAKLNSVLTSQNLPLHPPPRPGHCHVPQPGW